MNPYHGLHPNANPLQQTYDQLQNRAIQELNDEIKRLKDIILDKDEDINKLKEITNQGTLQKKLAQILEENNKLKLEAKEHKNNEAKIKQISDELRLKNDEIYRFQEKINILNDEYQEILTKNQALNQEISQKTKIIQSNKYKDDEITSLNQKCADYEELINDLKNATKINDLETKMAKLNKEISTINEEKVILTQNNKHLTVIHDEIKTKYGKLLNDFDQNVAEKQLKIVKECNVLQNKVTQITADYNSELNKTQSLKIQIKDLQNKYSKMEQLNMKLIKGYNVEEIVNDLQNEQNQKLNLQNELKQITKKLSKKEKTNLILLNKTKMLTQTLNLSQQQNGTKNVNFLMNADEESTDFDHIDEINELKQNMEGLHQQIDKLEGDKYKLLMQIHEQNECENDSDNGQNDKFLVSGLSKLQQQKVSNFVKRLRKKSLMPNDIDSDFEDDDIEYLKNENERLKEWKDTLMTKLFETQQIKSPKHHNVEHDDDECKEVETQRIDFGDSHFLNTTNKIFEIASKESLCHLLGVSNKEMDESKDCLTQINEQIIAQKQFVDVALNVFDNLDDAKIDFDVLMMDKNKIEKMNELIKENEKLQNENADLKGYKLRHCKIESILNEKNESELIKKMDLLSKENMILVVNEKKLSKKFIDLKHQQKDLFNEYCKLLKKSMKSEQFLFNKMVIAQDKNEYFRIFVSSMLQRISNEMVPLTEYKNIEIECKHLMDTRSHLLSIIDRFQSFCTKYFEAKGKNICFENELIDLRQNECSKDENESVHNAECFDANNDKNAINESIKTTEREYAKTKKKYENAMEHIKENEADSAKLHTQINELRTICVNQSATISKLEQRLNSDVCDLNKFNSLQQKYEVLSVEYEQKCVQNDSLKQKTDFAVSSLQKLQTKIMNDIETKNEKKIENMLKNTQQNIGQRSDEMIKSLKDRVCSLECKILRDDKKFHDLQSAFFNVDKAKRFLEANFNCIYSKILHKTSNKYLFEIDDLRSENEELLECLNEAQRKNAEICQNMFGKKTIIESLKVKIENLNDLNKQYEVENNHNEYLKNWQNKCTNLEIKQIEFVNENDSLKNEICFLRNENKKYLKNIGSLQKNLSVTNQELQNAKQEIIKKIEQNELNSLQESVGALECAQVSNKCVQTTVPTMAKDDDGNKNKNKNEMNAMNEKIVSLQATIRVLQNESIHTEERVNNATKGLQIMLKTAKDSIQSLQTLLSQKNESIEQYKAMIDKLLKKLKTQQSAYSQHMNALKIAHNADQQKNEKFVLSQIQKTQSTENENAEWIQLSEMKTTLQEKQNIIKKLEVRNVELSNDAQSNLAKIGVLNGRIDEYHQIIKELNEKIRSLSDNLSAFKAKFASKKKENFHLHKAVKSLKCNVEQSNISKKSEKNEKNEKTESKMNEEMDDKMLKMENEYKILRCSLNSQMNEKNEKMNAHKIENSKLMQTNCSLMKEIETLQTKLSTKSALMHKLQIQISKIQKDKITMHEKHSLSLKMNGKKMQNLQKQNENLQKELDSKSKLLKTNKNKAELSKFKKKSNDKLAELKKKINDLQNEMNKKEQKFEKMCGEKEKMSQKLVKLQRENESLINEERNENEKENESLYKVKYESAQKKVFDLRRMIEIEQMQKMKKLQNERDAVKRKYELQSIANDDDKFNNKQLTKLLDEIECKDNKIIDLETKITELTFEREELEINHQKLKKKVDDNDNGTCFVNNISSRNDPQLQNLLDSMRFIINKLKKENQCLKNNQNKNNKMMKESNHHSVRINNLLKENRALKKRQSEFETKDKFKDNEHLLRQIEQKQVEIERICNLNRRLRKDNVHLKEVSAKYTNSEQIKQSEIDHLRKVIDNERNVLKQQIAETNNVWKRKLSVSNDDLQRFKQIKKDLECELVHKNEINEKMATEIKALIELIDHTKNIQKQQSENGTKQIDSLQRENEELRSELSAFDVSFFNEIEDLKYRESKAQQTIIELKAQLNDINNHDSA